jgi:[acyl-carrier-protein] S-malonyltransferase
MNAFIFPGQGSQFSGMAKSLYESNNMAKAIMDEANNILGFSLTQIMFEGTDEALKQTNVTQPAIFLHSVALINTIENFAPDMVAGHSLGEFSALVACKALSWQDGLKLVAARSIAMQVACEQNPGTMAAILGLSEDIIEDICSKIDDVVVPANYNCPGQIVISGSLDGVQKACEALKGAGAKRALLLPVGGAFHSPLMKPAQLQLQEAIVNTTFNQPICPIYQNVNALPFVNPLHIKANLIEQLVSPVKWTQTVQKMTAAGAKTFTEIGPGKVLQGLVNKIEKEVIASSIS